MVTIPRPYVTGPVIAAMLAILLLPNLVVADELSAEEAKVQVRNIRKAAVELRAIAQSPIPRGLTDIESKELRILNDKARATASDLEQKANKLQREAEILSELSDRRSDPAARSRYEEARDNFEKAMEEVRKHYEQSSTIMRKISEY